MKLLLPKSQLLAVAGAFVLAALMLFASAQPGCAQSSDDAPAGQAENAAESAQADAELEQLLDVPDGSAEELIAYLPKLMRATPGDRTPAEAREFLRKTSNAVVDAADKLLAFQPQEKETALAYQIKILGLQRLARIDEPNAAEKLDSLMRKLRDDPRESVAAAGWQAFIMQHFQRWRALDESEKQAFEDEIIAALRDDGVRPLEAELVQVVSQQTERADVEFTLGLLERAVPLLEASDDPAIVEFSQGMVGTARRLNLPGNKMELEGTRLDGSEFDWEDYRGKVVLVDFWATWCGPCRQELPNVLEMYDLYHDRGFDVVGISLDSKKESAETFIEENDIPWPTLFPEDPEQRKWNNPIAQYYGISAIPTAILVDQQGRVVEMEAYGATLQEKLRELLGAPDAASASGSERSTSRSSVADEAAVR